MHGLIKILNDLQTRFYSLSFHDLILTAKVTVDKQVGLIVSDHILWLGNCNSAHDCHQLKNC
jgi:hypothetical protein